jgi:hypothetical protein
VQGMRRKRRKQWRREMCGRRSCRMKRRKIEYDEKKKRIKGKEMKKYMRRQYGNNKNNRK